MLFSIRDRHFFFGITGELLCCETADLNFGWDVENVVFRDDISEGELNWLFTFVFAGEYDISGVREEIRIGDNSD